MDPEAIDRQIGVIPLIRRIIAIDPSLKFDDPITMDHVALPAKAQPVPVGVGGGPHDTKWLQDALNKAYLPPNEPLLIDGSYGRLTREAVRSFQRFNRLEPDGLFGPKTDAALTATLQGVQR